MTKSQWLSKLRPASFRGVAFFVEATSGAVGRRVVSHEFPKRDMPFTEDLGRKQQSFTLECYVVGSDYFSARNAILAACEKEGPGELVHPYLGSKNVVCTTCQVQESSDAGGIARFTLTFLEAGEKSLPLVGLDATAKLTSASETLSNTAGNDFSSTWSVLGAPGFVVASALNAVAAAGSFFDRAANGLPGNSVQLARLLNSITKMKSDISELIKAPGSLQGLVKSIVQDFAEAFRFDDPFAVKKSERAKRTRAQQGKLSELSTFGRTLPTIAKTTANKVREAKNQEALVRLIETEVVLNASREAAAGEYATLNELVSARAELFARLDALAETAESTETYLALVSVQDAIATALPVSSDRAPEVVTIRPLVTRALLPLLYDLLGSVELEDDVSLRNNLRHPGFVTGGQPLEVVSDE